MTAPRQILPGVTYLVTRRCSERRFFLRPGTVINEIFLYVLAVAARRNRVAVHGYCVLSNHYHLVVTDTAGRLPAFMQDLNSLVARATNAWLGRWEGFWSSEASYSAVKHGDEDDVIRKMAYVLANPVAAGLVRVGREWPGLRTAPEQLGVAKFVAQRPKVFFRADGDMPAIAELTLSVPEGFAAPQDFQQRVRDAVEALEDEHRRANEKAQRGFLGRARVLAQKPFVRPASGEPRRQLSPRVAARDKWKRVEALCRLKEFLSTYRTAWSERRAGALDVVFPAGTYQLRLEHGVRCAAAG
jgi:putative transposase